MKTSQIVTLIVGILGGLAGIGSGIAVMGLGGLGGVIGAEGAGGVFGRGVGAIILSILGMIGAGIVGNNPKASGILMILASIVGFLIIFPFYLPASILFLVGGILAFISRKKE